MRLFRNAHFDFLGKRKIAAAASGVVIMIGLVSLLIKGGPMLGIDFTGGTLAQIQFTTAIDVGELRTRLLEQGFTRPTIQQFGAENEILIRVPVEEGGASMDQRLAAAFTGLEFETRRRESVGPKIGGELKWSAIQAIFFAMLGILIYISIRFDRYYALGAVAALVHDVLITLGIFSVLNLEIDLAIIAAFLTIVGYSLNDTIVVFDRIRENYRNDRKTDFIITVNRSINETLSRTIVTSATTFTVVFILYQFGGEVIRFFALALIIGVIVGTYSSIYIASPLMATLEIKSRTKAKGSK